MRTVEDLPFVPTTWIARNALLRACRARSAAGACAPARSACRTARARAGASSACVEVPGTHVASSSSSRRSRASLSRSAWTTGGGRLGDEALVGELALGARDLRLAARRAARRARRCSASRSTASEASTSTVPPGTPTVATGSPPSADHSTRARRDDVLGHALVAAGLAAAPARALARRRADAVAPAAQLLHGRDRAAELRPRPPRRAAPSSGSGQRWAISSPPAPGHVGPDLLGDERDHRVRERERLAQHVQRERRPRRRCRRRRAAA